MLKSVFAIFLLVVATEASATYGTIPKVTEACDYAAAGVVPWENDTRFILVAYGCKGDAPNVMLTNDHSSLHLTYMSPVARYEKRGGVHPSVLFEAAKNGTAEYFYEWTRGADTQYIEMYRDLIVKRKKGPFALGSTSGVGGTINSRLFGQGQPQLVELYCNGRLLDCE
ncbi:MAG: hypothetical protein GJ680_07330 [Alteromonadaceae bacterium]|nr:hypothetical protein [Alteromonadaceae bacterium]